MSSQCVLIGDIRSSRELQDWPAVFGDLQNALREVNEQFADDIVVAFGPTVGDEFQGVLRDARNAYAVYVLIKSGLRARFYCGIGVGEVEKPLEQAIYMRGSAFYRGRDALETCKAKRRSVIINSSDADGLQDRIANTLLYFVEVLEDSWTDRQRQVLSFYRAHPGYTQEEVGAHFGVSKQAVGQLVKAGGWQAISEGEGVLQELLVRISSEDAAL